MLIQAHATGFNMLHHASLKKILDKQTARQCAFTHCKKNPRIVNMYSQANKRLLTVYKQANRRLLTVYRRANRRLLTVYSEANKILLTVYRPTGDS